MDASAVEIRKPKAHTIARDVERMVIFEQLKDRLTRIADPVD